MKNFIIIMVVGIILSSCSTSKSFLSQNYNAQKTFTTQKSFNHVWDNVIDIFAENGITVTNMEKASGFISANGIEFNDHYTVEKKNDKHFSR